MANVNHAILASKLTPVVREAFENGSLYAEEMQGMIYISSACPSNPKRRFRVIGLVKEGLRRLTESVKRIASEY